MMKQMPEVSVQEFSTLKDQDDIVLVDVRTYDEFEYANIGGLHIPLDELEERFLEVDKSKNIYCLCHHGVRSMHAQAFLLNQGFERVYNITGGIEAWSCDVDEKVKRY